MNQYLEVAKQLAYVMIVTFLLGTAYNAFARDSFIDYVCEDAITDTEVEWCDSHGYYD